MTEEQLHKQTKQLEIETSAENFPKDKRRRLLKSAVAIPVIMTLQSGAALARTSNLVSPIQDTAAALKTDQGDLVCIHPGEGGDINSDPVDLGEAPYATVDSGSRLQDGTPDLATQATNCHNGGGILVSVNAWNSIGPTVRNF